MSGRRWEVLCGGLEASARAGAATLVRIGRRAAALGDGAVDDPALARMLAQADIVYLASGAGDEPAALPALAALAGATGTVLALGVAGAAAFDAVALADIVLFDETAFRTRFDASPGPAALRRVLALGPHTVVVTVDGHGAMAASGAGFAQAPAIRPGRPASFHAAFLDAWLDGIGLEDALRRAGARA